MKLYNIIIIPTYNCNLECDYCFEYKRSNGVMTLNNFKHIIDKIKTYAVDRGIDKINIYWQGGEVLLLPTAYLTEAVEYSYDIFNKSGICSKHYLQSNLMTLPKDKIQLLKTHFDNSIGTSLDFPNLYRKAKKDLAQFEKTWLSNLRLIQENNINIGVISVLNSSSLECEPSHYLKYYYDLDIRSLQINLPFSIGLEGKYALNPESTGNFLSKLFIEWKNGIDTLYLGLHVSPFKELMLSLKEGLPAISCVWSGSCYNNTIAIDYLGNVSVCDCWVNSLPEYQYGNIYNEDLHDLMDSDIRKKFAARYKNLLATECRSCRYVALCNGGCIIRSSINGFDLTKTDWYCKSYMYLFRSIENIMEGST